MNTKEFKNIVNNINNIWRTKYTHAFKDIENKEPIFNFAKEINQVNGVSFVSLSNNRKKIPYNDFDGEKQYFYLYPISITISNLKVTGQINAIPKNEHEYNIVLCLELDKRVLESIRPLNESLDFKQFVKDLKQCKSFSDIKNTVKKYYKEGVVLGTLLTAVLCNYSLSADQYRDLSYIDNNFGGYYYDEQFPEGTPDEDAYVSPDTVPNWEYLCNNCIATIYHAVEEQCNKDPEHTCCMFHLNLKNPASHKIIAVERTMMTKYDLHFGDFILVKGAGKKDGVYQIQDIMNSRFENKNTIDFLVNLDEKTGKWDNVSLFKLVNKDTCGDKFKQDMAPALNQKYIDRRQNH